MQGFSARYEYKVIFRSGPGLSVTPELDFFPFQEAILENSHNPTGVGGSPRLVHVLIGEIKLLMGKLRITTEFRRKGRCKTLGLELFGVAF